MVKLKDLILPDPDGQFRLRGCKCGCKEPGYILLGAEGREKWGVECPDCGKATPGFPVRHDAQVYWNRNLAAPALKVRCSA